LNFLKQSTVATVMLGPFISSANGSSASTGLTISQADVRLSKNGANFAQKSSGTAATHNEAGWYSVPLNGTDANTVGALIVAVHEAGALPVWREFQIVEEDIFEALLASSAAAFNSSDQVTVGSIAANAITATSIASFALTAVKIGTDAITSDKIAANAIGASELAADAITEIRSLATGTSDSGGAGEIVDAERTEADDVWTGAWILFTSGAFANKARIITDFDAAADRITFSPSVGASVGSGITYEILPNAGVDVQSLRGANSGLDQPGFLINGRVDADVTNSLATDTYAEPGQEAPGATVSLATKIGYLYKFLRNKITQTSTTLSVFADDASTVDQKATVSDDATTYTRGEIGTGP